MRLTDAVGSIRRELETGLLLGKGCIVPLLLMLHLGVGGDVLHFMLLLLGGGLLFLHLLLKSQLLLLLLILHLQHGDLVLPLLLGLIRREGGVLGLEGGNVLLQLVLDGLVGLGEIVALLGLGL